MTIKKENFIGNFGLTILKCLHAGTITEKTAKDLIQESHLESGRMKSWERKTFQEKKIG